MKHNMENRVKITVVTPSYNQGGVIEDTIRSVISQEGYFFIDYIIMDGGSTDDSVEIIRKYDQLLKEEEWPVKCLGIQYRWLSEKDKGQTDAINKGILMAHGEIINWINSDDTLLPGALQSVVDAFSKKPDTDMVYGEAYYTDEKGNIIEACPTRPFRYENLAVASPMCQPSVFYKRKVLLDAGLLNIELHYTMDYDLWLRIGKGCEIRQIPAYLATYRLHSESKTVAESHSILMQKEILDTVQRYFGRVPVNRVFAYCYYRVREWLPSFLRQRKAIIIPLSILLTLKEYLVLNKGVRREDIRMALGLKNIKKIFFGWEVR